MILLNNGQALVVGVGDSEKAAELYNPNSGTWTNTSSMSVMHSGGSLTLLANGQVLVAGGDINPSGTVTTNGAEIYNPTTGTWTNTGRMTVARSAHSATLLPSGKVLVAGGSGATYGSLLASSELYDPATGTWVAVANSMHAARESHSAVLLPNGKVLVGAGYEGIGTPAASSEIFDPAAQTWTSTTTPLNTPRASQTMTLLSDGKVLVAGGYNIVDFRSVLLSSAEVFDPATGAWTTTNSMNIPHSTHTATLLQSGKVLVAGGGGRADYSSAEVFDPTTGTWTQTSSLIVGRFGHQAVRLPNGKVLVEGGDGAGTSTELYTDSPSGAWAPANPSYVARENHTATLLTNGMVLIAGGLDSSGSFPQADVELFDPATGDWQGTDSLPAAVGLHTATLLSGGGVLVAGGCDSEDPLNPLTNTEVYDPSVGLWTPADGLNNARCGHTATRLLNGQVLVAGGDAGGVSAELFDPATGSWTPTGSLNTPHASGHTAALLPDGKVLVAGGLDTDGNWLADVEIYEPIGRSWTPANPMTTGRTGHTMTVLTNGLVLVAGGDVSAELYHPSTGNWTAITNPMVVPRFGHTATLLPNGKVLLAGGNLGTYPYSRCTAELYDPVTETFTYTGCLIDGRAFQTATLLSNGLVLAVGGQGVGNNAATINSAELYQPETQTVTVAPFYLTNPGKLPAGAFHFTFASTPGESFSVFATTNLALPFSSWMFLGAATDSPPGSYQFTDSQATNSPNRFYRVRSP